MKLNNEKEQNKKETHLGNRVNDKHGKQTKQNETKRNGIAQKEQITRRNKNRTTRTVIKQTKTKQKNKRNETGNRKTKPER